MDRHSCLYYLRIFHSDIIAVQHFALLLKKFQSIRAIVDLPAAKLLEIGFNSNQINVLKDEDRPQHLRAKVDSDYEWSCKAGNSVLCFESADYPALLREIDSPPPVLFMRGSLNALKANFFSIVGSRRASSAGKRNAYWIAGELSQCGLQISSGLAAGIDTKAHEGCLDRGGTTVAIMGTGIDGVYPNSNRNLASRILERGALVSEFTRGTLPYPGNFPRRNRIISGLAKGTLVVEATSKSGSLITARLAMEQNREVFALPGSINSQLSRGCHRLIKQGAKLVEEPADILEELGLEYAIKAAAEVKNSGSKSPQASQRRVLDAIGHQGSLFQSLLDECSIDIQELNIQLIQLELAGLISQQGGRYYRSG